MNPNFNELKAKYNVPQEGVNDSDSNFLYFILAKADINIDLLNDVDLNWLKNRNFLETFELLQKIKKDQENKIKKLAQEDVLNLYYKYKFLFSSIPIDFFDCKHNLELKYSIRVLNNPLASILFKLDLSGNLNQEEISYLIKKDVNKKKLLDFLKLIRIKKQYNITNYDFVSTDDILYIILCKLEKIEQLKNNEVTILKEYNLFTALETYVLQEKSRIKTKLNQESRLNKTEIEFLQENNINDLLEIHQQQEHKRQEEFIKLKEKYHASQYVETSLNSPLYQILLNLEACETLSNDNLNWLKSHNLNDTLAIAEFMALKVKYKATKNEDLSITSHLYKVLKKIDSNKSDIPLPESDLNFLKKQKLIETFNLALDQYANYLISQIELGNELTEDQLNWLEKYQRQDVIKVGKTKHFQKLKEKYEVSELPDHDSESQLYLILQKLDNNLRLDPVDIAYLKDTKFPKNQRHHDNQRHYYRDYFDDENDENTGKSLFTGKIFRCFNAIEAQFYEADYQKTGNKWNLPNISSHWRKADEPEKALNATKNVNFDSIKENKLKSAILTTRGGAFRDLDQLDDAEKCARKAIEYQPNSYHPYTLMGAICFQRGQYSEGEKWFEEAIKRGASRDSIDSEIKKSITRMEEGEMRDEMINKLLEKDTIRYSWANKYLTKNIDSEIKKSLEKMTDQEKREQKIRYLLQKDARRYGWANKYLSKNKEKKRN